MDWIVQHGPALVAFAGAAGTATAALAPKLDAKVKQVGAKFGPVVAVIGAVVHAYVQGAG